MGKRAFNVSASWDAEVGVWYVDVTDIPGLATEAATFEDLVRRVLEIAPELIRENAHELGERSPDDDLPISVMAKRLALVRVPG